MDESTQKRILDAGKSEFLEKGFKSASLRSIAQKAGVTTGAIYGYYPDKEALFGALVEGPAHRELMKSGGIYADFVKMREKSIGRKLGA